MWDNPTPPEMDKCFVFKAHVSSVIEGYVWARSEEEARDRINCMEWDELEDTNIEQIEDIVEMKEE